MKELKISVHESYDILVVGAGLAGLRAAFTSASKGAKTLLSVSSHIASGSSFYPMMDTIHALAPAPGDEEILLSDISLCSQRMNDIEMNRYFVNHVRDAILKMGEIGIEPEKLKEKKLPCFGSHYHELYCWKDWNECRRNIRKKIKEKDKLEVLENAELLLLVKDCEKVAGALFFVANEIIYIPAKAVILATGGFGELYRHSLNTKSNDGAGHFAALAAGASLINLEFNQLMPGFVSPIYKIVFREGSLDYCTALLDKDGNNLLEKIDNVEEVLKRRTKHGPFTTSDSTEAFDIAILKDEGVVIKYDMSILEDERSYIKDYVSWLKTSFELDISKAEIKIAPFFHAANGGILIGHDCQTSVLGLFACGECAGGIHGADRLGGTSSGSCLAFGELAANAAVDYAKQVTIKSLKEKEILSQIIDSYGCDKRGRQTPSEVMSAVKDLMYQNAMVIRSDNSLSGALEEIDRLKVSFACQSPLAFKAQRELLTAKAILLSMKERRESRGSHYRKDFPLSDNAYLKRIVCKKEEGELKVSFESLRTE